MLVQPSFQVDLSLICESLINFIVCFYLWKVMQCDNTC